MLDRRTAMARAFEFKFKSELRGDYAEFGIFQGASLINALKAHDKFSEKFPSEPHCQFYAFDSFQGLPKISDADEMENYNVFEAGQYACSVDDVKENIKKSGKSPNHIRFIPGFYNDSLIKSEVVKAFNNKIFSIIHIDCDLYSSARDCLTFITDKFEDGTLILFDDWFCFKGRKDKGVQKAFYEWIHEYKIQHSEYFRYSWAGICFFLHKT